MSNLTTRTDNLIAGLPSPIRDRLAKLLNSRRTVNTLRAYNIAWRNWQLFTVSNNLPGYPTTPEAIAHYLVDRHSVGAKKSSIATVLTVLRLLHRGRADDPTAAPLVTETWTAIQRTDQRPTKRAPSIGLHELIIMIESLDRVWAAVGMPSDDKILMRNRALLAVGWAGALRSAELVALRWSDIRLTDRGAEVTIRASKTDQTGAGVTLALPWYREPFLYACPARALATMQRGTDPDARVFPLTTRQVSRIVSNAARAAGLPGHYSAHSLRRGFATWAAENKIADRLIMRQGRWRSRAVMDRYVDAGTLWTDNALVAALGRRNSDDSQPG